MKLVCLETQNHRGNCGIVTVVAYVEWQAITAIPRITCTVLRAIPVCQKKDTYADRMF